MSVGRPRLLSNADVHRAKALVRSGSSTRRVATLMDVGHSTLKRRLSQPYKQAERRW